MGNVFLISDTHFGHQKACEFLNNDGSKMRPWDNSEEMNEAMVKNWNSVVGPKDKVYHLGDVVIGRKHLKTLERLNGDKVLIRGNHDIFKLVDYLPYFRDIRAVHKLDDFVMSHIPIHPDSLGRYKANVHGHLHSNKVMGARWYRDGENEWQVAYDIPHSKYLCVSVEQINYTPISLEAVIKLLKEQQS